MFRAVTKDMQDSWGIIKERFISVNSDRNLAIRVKPADKVKATISTNDKKYIRNTCLPIKLRRDFRDPPGKSLYRWNRVNLGVFLRGLKLNRRDLDNLTTQAIIKYFEESQIFLTENCDFTIKDSTVTISAKFNNYLFYGSITIPIVDKKIDISTLIKRDTITFAPNGSIWIDDALNLDRVVKSNNKVNDLLYATINLSSNPLVVATIQQLLGDQFITYGLSTIYGLKQGSKLKDILDDPNIMGDYFIKGLINAFSVLHNGLSYGWIASKEDEALPENKNIIINLAECIILYAGENTVEAAGEYYRNIEWDMYGRVEKCPRIIAIKPTDESYDIANIRYITIGTY